MKYMQAILVVCLMLMFPFVSSAETIVNVPYNPIGGYPARLVFEQNLLSIQISGVEERDRGLVWNALLAESHNISMSDCDIVFGDIYMLRVEGRNLSWFVMGWPEVRFGTVISFYCS